MLKECVMFLKVVKMIPSASTAVWLSVGAITALGIAIVMPVNKEKDNYKAGSRL